MNTLTWIITACLGLLPYVFNRLLHIYLKRPFSPSAFTVIVPIICAILYPIARFLPEPNITSDSITLAQHFVGGGFISALYYIYFIRELKVRLPIFVYFLVLYAFVSMMGVTNELLEFTATRLHLYSLDGTDTWWDLLANTLGAYSIFSIYYLVIRLSGKKLDR